MFVWQKVSLSGWMLSLINDRSSQGAAANSRRTIVTTNSTPSNSARRRRISAATTVLVTAGALSGIAFGPAAPANAADTYVSIAWSTDTGAFGVADNQPTQDAVNNAALRMCRFSEPKNFAFGAHCATAVAGKDECVALAALAAQPGLNFPSAVGEGQTLQEAEQNAVGFDGTLKISKCSNGAGGVTPPPPPGQVAPPILGAPGQAH
jgi:hypothetical protein